MNAITESEVLNEDFFPRWPLSVYLVSQQLFVIASLTNSHHDSRAVRQVYSWKVSGAESIRRLFSF